MRVHECELSAALVLKDEEVDWSFKICMSDSAHPVYPELGL